MVSTKKKKRIIIAKKSYQPQTFELLDHFTLPCHLVYTLNYIFTDCMCKQSFAISHSSLFFVYIKMFRIMLQMFCSVCLYSFCILFVI